MTALSNFIATYASQLTETDTGFLHSQAGELDTKDGSECGGLIELPNLISKKRNTLNSFLDLDDDGVLYRLDLSELDDDLTPSIVGGKITFKPTDLSIGQVKESNITLDDNCACVSYVMGLCPLVIDGVTYYKFSRVPVTCIPAVTSPEILSTESEDFTLVASQDKYLISVDTDGGDVTVTLPSEGDPGFDIHTGFIGRLVNKGSSSVILTSTGTIEGNLTELRSKHGYLDVIYEGSSNWRVESPVGQSEQRRQETTDVTVTPYDNNYIIETATSGTITVTLPVSGDPVPVPAGFKIRVVNKGSGETVFSSSGTIQSKLTRLIGKYEYADLIYIGSDTWQIHANSIGTRGGVTQIASKVANYEITQNDIDSVIRTNTATSIDVTLPTGIDEPTVNFRATVVNTGAGETKFVSSGTISSKLITLKGSYASAQIIYIGSDTWEIVSDQGTLSKMLLKTEVDYTPVPDDNKTIIRVDTTTSKEIELPVTGITVGYVVEVINIGSGETTFVVESGGTLNAPSSGTKITAQHGWARFVYIGSNTYQGCGDLVP